MMYVLPGTLRTRFACGKRGSQQRKENKRTREVQGSTQFTTSELWQTFALTHLPAIAVTEQSSTSEKIHALNGALRGSASRGTLPPLGKQTERAGNREKREWKGILIGMAPI